MESEPVEYKVGPGILPPSLALAPFEGSIGKVSGLFRGSGPARCRHTERTLTTQPNEEVAWLTRLYSPNQTDSLLRLNAPTSPPGGNHG